jgi:hypothetical protein
LANERLHLDFNLRLGLYNRRSLMGEMMQQTAPTLAQVPRAVTTFAHWLRARFDG